MLGSMHTSDVRRFIPRLVHIGEAPIQRKHYKDAQGEPGKPIDLLEDAEYTVKILTYPRFKLDWGPVDQYKKDKYLQWVKDNWEDHLTPRTPDTLPKSWDDEIKSLTFTISSNYHHGINHFSRLFVSEYTTEYRFDTIIRDHCFAVAREAMNAALYLLADCIYDEEKQSWARGKRKWVRQILMTYKFWRLLTGRGNAWFYSGIPEIERTLKDGYLVKGGVESSDYAETVQLYSKVLTDIRGWEEQQEKFWAFTAGPKIEDTGESPDKKET